MIPLFFKRANIYLDSVSEKRLDSTLRSEFETGPIQQSKKECGVKIELSCRLAVCVKDYSDFLDWFDENSSGYFLMSHPLTGEQFRFRFKTNEISFRYVKGHLMEAGVIFERFKS